jgi:stage IV sporulation protein B
MRKKRIGLICSFLTPIIFLTLSIYHIVGNIPTTIFIREGAQLQSNHLIKLKEEDNIKVNNLFENSNTRTAKASLLGIVPLKSIYVKSVPSEISVYPGGQPIGVKLNTKGVLVVALSDIETEKGKSNSPAALAGVQIGDNIIKINSIPINSAEQVSRLVNESDGNELNIIIDRKGNELMKKIKPIKSIKDDKFKIGLWVRDSTAGVGTLTFYDNVSKKFGALGHPITDSDTGTTLNISYGEIVSSSIVSVRKGTRGNPGELKGIFVNEDVTIGNISKNTDCGIFGSSNKDLINKKFNKPIKIGLRNEIKEGPAKIITTIDGEEPRAYDIKIEKLLEQDIPGPKSMLIRVVDPELLQKTGGIVQGMSGSPIIQDNKLVGAVTHVLINKPDTGYGIYIEWMLKDSDILTK